MKNFSQKDFSSWGVFTLHNARCPSRTISSIPSTCHAECDNSVLFYIAACIQPSSPSGSIMLIWTDFGSPRNFPCHWKFTLLVFLLCGKAADDQMGWSPLHSLRTFHRAAEFRQGLLHCRYQLSRIVGHFLRAVKMLLKVWASKPGRSRPRPLFEVRQQLLFLSQMDKTTPHILSAYSTSLVFIQISLMDIPEYSRVEVAS